MNHMHVLPRLANQAVRIIIVTACLHYAGGALAASEADIYRPVVRIQPTDIPTLQRGYQFFLQNCVSCHSLGLMRYNRIAEDLHWDEQTMRESGLIPAGAGMNDHVMSSLSPEAGLAAYGVSPPDLSLKARERGADWIHGLLNGYYQDPQSPTGFNNAVMKGTAMPNLLAGMQGMQKPVYADHNGKQVLIGLEKASEGSLNHKQFYEKTRDLVSFLRYASEPAILKRTSLGIWVIGFLCILLVLTWMLKREYWRDVH